MVDLKKEKDSMNGWLKNKREAEQTDKVQDQITGLTDYVAELQKLVDEVDEFQGARKEVFEKFDLEVPITVKKERNERLDNKEIAVENDVLDEKFSMITTSCKYKKPIA